MRIAYLVHTDRNYEEIIELVNQLTKQEDHVFIMINDNDLRDQIFFVYADFPRVHISKRQEYGQSGDLSLARGTIIQMKEALEIGGFDYFINLTDGMMPVKPRTEIISFLKENNGKDFYYVSCDEDQALRKKADRYYPFTNMLAFPTSKFIRALSKGTAAIFDLLHIKRNLTDHYSIGSPWFMLTRESANTLAEKFSYVADTFKLGWYPEEYYISMMMQKFVYVDGKEDTHINKDLRAVGPDGSWKESSDAAPLTSEILFQHPEALFAAKITTTDNLSVYSDYFDIYTRDYTDHGEREKKYEDPDKLIDSLLNKK
ncbi:glycogen branching protein [Erysipelotrichaceae bacterium AF15-26LB]|nr:hypothetical protein HMPREF0983_03876 [Erysipelotrichaceae bacterium 3_1_53]MCR0349793.1 beta-1,6-N-acetylglucosaminyltransferase [[Clostridium] innocuum]RJV92313.1 glycogen branching protein [Erysipelotrichaceae bacterium AF15-26LB]RJV92525.1 glycogen branching protein [Erysipelotrichaceae bacterium AF19-24AC]